MNLTKVLGIIIGVALAAFAIASGIILLFGLTNTFDAENPVSTAMFKTLCFALLLVVLGALYLAARKLFNTQIEHALIILSIIVFSAGVSAMAGGIKAAYDAEQFIARSESAESISSLQQQNQYYLQYAQSMEDSLKLLKSNNQLLEEDAAKIEKKIANKTPVVVETIVKIPGDIIYQEEEVPVYYQSDEEDDEEEEEDDD
jgi:hypothetical protein